jgi:predicted phage terminase large subunit-like protein
VENLTAQLPSDPLERRRLLDRLVDVRPELVRRWIERRPHNLMVYHGWDVQPFHAGGLDGYLDNIQSLWLAPRGSGKSTALMFAACWLGLAQPENRDPRYRDLFPDSPRRIDPTNIRIALTSNSQEKATALLWQVKAVLTDDRMVKLYGDLVGGRWQDVKSDTSLRTMKLREPTFTALGLGSTVTGGHYDVLVADDWVTEDNSRTEMRRQRLVDFWRLTVAPTREPWARTWAAGTRYHPQDFYHSIAQWKERNLWNHLRVDAALQEVNGQEVSYWPEAYTVPKLREIREQIGQVAFDTQYQNRVDVMLGEFFEREWVENYVRWDELPKAKRDAARTVIALDPAIKAGPRNDYSVFCVLSWVDGFFYVRRIVRGQWTQDEQQEIAVRLCHEYKAELLGIEVIGAQEWLVQGLVGKLGMRRVRALKPQQYRGKDKVGRASRVRSLFERGLVHLDEPTEANGVERLVYEMMAFPSSSDVPGMDDCVDALVWALLLIVKPRSRTVKLSNRRSL